jgi:hypothetical protein
MIESIALGLIIVIVLVIAGCAIYVASILWVIVSALSNDHLHGD